MPDTALETKQTPPDRPITHNTWRKILDACRPARYSVLVEQLEYLFDRTHILTLWRTVFQEEPPSHWSTYDAQCEFAGRMWRERFPVSLEDMDMVYNSGGNPMAGPIQIQGAGVPWECCSLDDLHPAALIAMEAVWQWMQFPEDMEDQIDMLWDDLVAILSTHGVPDRLRVNLPINAASLAQLERTLEAQPTPWPGVAGLFHAILKDTGNPFIDWTGTWFQGEYDQWSEWYWDPDDIRALSDLFAQARPMYNAIDDLYSWYEITSRAGAKIAEHLAPLLLQTTQEGDTQQ